MTSDLSSTAERLSEIHRRIEAACSNAGRPKGSVELVAVSKQQPIDLIRAAVTAGQYSFGENYAQELLSKSLELPNLSWHFIGHLQSNKAKLVVGRCKLIQSVDSARIAGKIADIAKDLGAVQDVLIEVNVSGEPTKTGVSFDLALELCQQVVNMENMRLVGLMGIAPIGEQSAETAGKCFARLRKLYETLPVDNRKVLSMGMSADFVEAIAEGSTMVRIGSAIFGSRPQPA